MKVAEDKIRVIKRRLWQTGIFVGALVVWCSMASCGRSKLVDFTMIGEPSESCTQFGEYRGAIISMYNGQTGEAWNAPAEAELFRTTVSGDRANDDLFNYSMKCHDVLHKADSPDANPEKNPDCIQARSTILGVLCGVKKTYGQMNTFHDELLAGGDGISLVGDDQGGELRYVISLFYGDSPKTPQTNPEANYHRIAIIAGTVVNRKLNADSSILNISGLKCIDVFSCPTATGSEK